MAITEEQARVYQIICDMFMKAICTLAALVAFFWILHTLLTSDEEWQIKTVYGGVEIMILLVYKHYFPSKKDK